MKQRARLLNAILADLYGPGRLLAEGLLPPAVIHGHHSYLWPCRGLEPLGGTFLHSLAATWRARPMGAGGSWPIARKERPAQATRCKTG